MRKTFLTAILSIIIAPVFAQQNAINILDFGAHADGVFDNTLAIQKAINAAFDAGGGKVIVPDGYYVTGQLTLKTGVELHLTDKATLLGSTNRLDYKLQQSLALISARNQQNISITGKGTINGRGRELIVNLLDLLAAGKIEDPQWRIKRPTEENRPKILSFNNCNNVKITGIQLKDAACWVQNYSNCTGVFIDSITVNSVAYWNNDGIDISDCKNVKITNSFINAADDAICLKSNNPDKSCENIEVSNCSLRSSASGFKLGTGSVGGFKKIKVRNLTIYNTYRSAIALEAVDGGTIEDVDIRGVNAKNTGNAIFIRLGHRNTGRYSTVHRVYIGDVTADVPSGKPDIGYPMEGPPPKVAPHNLVPSSITGLAGHPVQDITLENIDITYGGGAAMAVAYTPLTALKTVNENINGYPEFTMFGELPAWGLYVRHAEGIHLKNIKIRYLKDEFRPGYTFDDVTGLELSNIIVETAKNLPVIVMQDVIAPVLRQIKLPVDDKNAIKVQ
jgi:polygalacturonase